MSVVSDAGRSAARGQRLPRRERRAQLLDAAREVFVASGYHSAAMDDIAEAAGVSKPVLYQHFPGKLELYLALLDSSSDALVAAVETALASTADNKLRVQATVQAYFDFVDDPAGRSASSSSPTSRTRAPSATGSTARTTLRAAP